MTRSPDAPQDVFILVVAPMSDHRREGQATGGARKGFLADGQPYEKSSASTVAADAPWVGR